MIDDREAVNFKQTIDAQVKALNAAIEQARSRGLRVDLSTESRPYTAISEDPDADRSEVVVRILKRIAS